VVILERISEAVRSRPAWKVSYVQEYVPAGMTAGETVSGTLVLAWPDRALFTEGEPPVRSMGLEGRKVRLVDLEARSCDDHVLTDREWTRIPLVAMLDPAKALDRFSLAVSEDALVLVPREPGSIARTTVRPGPDGLPSEVTVEDVSGAINRFRFSGWRPASGLPEGWLPEPPEGVTCVSDDG